MQVCLRKEESGREFCFSHTNLFVDLQSSDAILMNSDIILHVNLLFSTTNIFKFQLFETESYLYSFIEEKRMMSVYVIYKNTINNFVQVKSFKNFNYKS